MAAWLQLVRLGDPGFTVPAAAAIAAWLLAARAWRMAFWWSGLFIAAMSLVAASKIAYMGWGGYWPTLSYKALSGHATGATAVLPVMFYLLAGTRWRRAAAGAGLVLGAVLTMALVASNEHSVAEAFGGWCAGAAASMVALGMAGNMPHHWRPWLAFGLVFVIAAWLMQWAHLGYWMIKAARLLSGRQTLFNLRIDE
jgi:hypothetical protein